MLVKNIFLRIPTTAVALNFSSFHRLKRFTHLFFFQMHVFKFVIHREPTANISLFTVALDCMDSSLTELCWEKRICVEESVKVVR